MGVDLLRDSTRHDFTMKKQPLDDSNLELPSRGQKQEDETHPYSEAAAQHSSDNELYNEEFLCDDCKAVDWSSLPPLAADGLLQTRGSNLRTVNATVKELRNSSCRICAILSTIKNFRSDGKRCELVALPLSRKMRLYGDRLPRKGASRCEILGIVCRSSFREGRSYFESSVLAVTKLDELGARTIEQSSVDYSKFKELLKICDKYHEVCCAIEPRPNVFGLEVIDIKTQEVVKAPDGCRYLALSYVWGKESDSSSAHNIRDSPPVIRDAISVTKSMGYSYLWVDRYVSHFGSM